MPNWPAYGEFFFTCEGLCQRSKHFISSYRSNMTRKPLLHSLQISVAYKVRRLSTVETRTRDIQENHQSSAEGASFAEIHFWSNNLAMLVGETSAFNAPGQLEAIRKSLAMQQKARWIKQTNKQTKKKKKGGCARVLWLFYLPDSRGHIEGNLLFCVDLVLATYHVLWLG